jgi:hypothetical protein
MLMNISKSDKPFYGRLKALASLEWEGPMNQKTWSFLASRREFLKNVMPAGTLFCLGCTGSFARGNAQGQKKPADKKHKFLEDAGMSFQEVFELAYKEFAQLMKYFANEIGKGNLIEMIKRASDEEVKQAAKKETRNLQENDFASFRAEYRKKPDRFWDHILTSTIIEDTDKAIESKITECLFAKTFRDANAADIGYAYCCHLDFASAQAYNPKLRLIRTKTLMNGDDCCNPRRVWEG